MYYMPPVVLWPCSRPVTVNPYLFTQDADQWDSLYNALGSRCYIIAGSASKSISKLLEERSLSTPRSSGRIIKHTNQTTMSDLVEIGHLLDSEYKRHRLSVNSVTQEAENRLDSGQ